MIDDEFYRDRAQHIRELADKADPFICKLLLDLAGNYDAMVRRSHRATAVVRPSSRTSRRTACLNTSGAVRDERRNVAPFAISTWVTFWGAINRSKNISAAPAASARPFRRCPNTGLRIGDLLCHQIPFPTKH
jgi:hypothetical protein